ncbi:transposase [Xanthomonas citri]|uniref:transposase n=1 Tax=Xanthomonas citri TaxID=346 RepID=UPI000BB48CD0|nr:transposase [Xanthomonas citri]ATB59897.1 Xfu2 transposase [Xanthomonas citri pv. fuscans]
MQLTFGDAEGLGKRKQTRREIFLAEMEQVVPWQQLLGLIALHYPTSGRPGRQPYALATMLRIHLLQQWYALSDPAMEEKASVRAKVEHPFRVIKHQFGYTKVRYRGLAKNTAQVLTLFALSNLWMKRKQLLSAAGSVRL